MKDETNTVGGKNTRQPVRANQLSCISSVQLSHSIQNFDEVPTEDSFDLETDEEDAVLAGATECDALDRALLHITMPPFPTEWVRAFSPYPPSPS